MPNEWGDEATNEWGDSPAAAPPTPKAQAPANRWVQKVGEGLVPGYNRLVALGSAATDPLFGVKSGDSFGERYQGTLRSLQGQSGQTQREHPYISSMAQAVGSVPSALLMPAAPAVAAGAPLLNRAASSALAAAPIGAAYAAGDAPADASAGETLARTGMGALAAGGIGAAIPVAGAVVGPVSKKLQSVAVTQGRKALSGVGTPLSARKEIPEAVVREALDSGAIRPLGTVTGTAGRLERAADEIGAEYAQILASLEAKGVHGPEAEALARELSSRAGQAAQTSLNSARPAMLQSTADELGTKALPIAGRGRLGLSQAEQMKRGLQQEAKREYDKITRQYTTAGETKKEIASVVRGGIEDAVQQQASLAPAEAAAFEPVKAKLSNTLGALRVAEEGAARATRRKPISLTSTIAGSAAGAATGSPVLGVLSALGHGVMDARLASTLASGANTGARLLGGPALPSAASTAVRSTLPVETDPIVRALMEALAGRRVRLVPASADEESP